ncbi:hypothetical protein AB0368_35860 [Actinoplanes sp. NPDC051475]|uniref:hypothetical protein n=1 Tax=Actinoplanes sp. NPDC051475 TaxID=3157225 RepID=UPI003450541E
MYRCGRAPPARRRRGGSRSRRAWVRDQEVTLRPKEHELLAVLVADAGDRWDRIATLRGYGYRFELD